MDIQSPIVDLLINSELGKNPDVRNASLEYDDYIKQYLLNDISEFKSVFSTFENTYIGDGTHNTFELNPTDSRKRRDQYMSKIYCGHVDVNSNSNPNFKQDFESLLNQFNVFYKYKIFYSILTDPICWSKIYYKIVVDEFIACITNETFAEAFYIFDSMFGVASYPILHQTIGQVRNLESFKKYLYLKKNIPEQYKQLYCGGDPSCRRNLEQKEKEKKYDYFMIQLINEAI